MPAYTVLLEKWSPLPHKDLGVKISAITGIHIQTIYSRLRLQQGIIAENLDLDRAETLAKYLTDSGYPSIVVEDSEVFNPGKVIQCRNADIVEGGIRIEDPYGNLTPLDIEKLIFLHVGWVEEFEKPDDNRRQHFGYLMTDEYGASWDGWSIQKRQSTGSIGWVLHIFSDEFGNNYLRICYNKFNYDYQAIEDESREKRFRRLLYDLKNLVPGDKLDESFMIALMCGGEIPDNLKFKDIDTVMKRIIWLRTMSLTSLR
ncbi:MAG: hypothetical protein NTY09_02855 [bacterium]|nr:hypothetical protein [bacterium]